MIQKGGLVIRMITYISSCYIKECTQTKALIGIHVITLFKPLKFFGIFQFPLFLLRGMKICLANLKE